MLRKPRLDREGLLHHVMEQGIVQRLWKEGRVSHDSQLRPDTPGNYAKGKLTTVSDASGSTQFAYDERGRTKSTTKSFSDGTSYTIQTGYDSRDRVKSITYPGSSPETVNYLYDTAGNLTNVQSTATNYAAYYDFNASGQAGNVWYGNNVQTIYTYDITTTRLTDILTVGGGTLQDLHYEYDDLGNMLTIADISTPARTQNFQYDELNRLRYADSPAYGSIEYRYDTIGNMTFNSRVGAYAYTDPLHVHAATQAGANTYTYDLNGNMMSGETRTFVWDYDNRPTSIKGIPMVYDYQGQRAKKDTTKYVGKLYECGSSCTMYIFGGRNRIAKKTGTSVNYYHPDHLGSSSVITNDTGSKVEEISYYPYGENRLPTSNVVKHRYTGQEWDSETGLYYYGARYYHPAIGRFISADTIVANPNNPQNLNRYAYVLNNPLRYVDPTGHYCDDEGCFSDPDPYVVPYTDPYIGLSDNYYSYFSGFDQYIGNVSVEPGSFGDVSLDSAGTESPKWSNTNDSGGNTAASSWGYVDPVTNKVSLNIYGRSLLDTTPGTPGYSNVSVMVGTGPAVGFGVIQDSAGRMFFDLCVGLSTGPGASWSGGSSAPTPGIYASFQGGQLVGGQWGYTLYSFDPGHEGSWKEISATTPGFSGTICVLW